MYKLSFGLLLITSVCAYDSAIIKNLHIHHGILLNRKIETTRNIPLSIKNVLNKPLRKANQDYALYAKNKYICLTKAEGILAVASRIMGARTFGLPADRSFFHIDAKSYLFHPSANIPQEQFLCPDVYGVFAPNFIVEHINQDQASNLIKIDLEALSHIKEISEDDQLTDILINGYKVCRSTGQHLCLTQIAMHESIATKLLYSMLDAKGQPLLNNAISSVLENQEKYLQNPLAYEYSSTLCQITLRNQLENFGPLLRVHHYFSNEASEWISELS